MFRKLLIICTVLASCTLLQNSNSEKEPLLIAGKVIITRYKIPVPANMRFYVKKKLVYETNSDAQGKYQAFIPNKYINTEAMLLITPKKRRVIKDTLIHNSAVLANFHNIVSSDTNYLILTNKAKQNWEIKNNLFFLKPISEPEY